jgi:AcrR family transcriptional regulator
MTSKRHRLPDDPVTVDPPDDPVLRAAYDAVLDLGVRRTTLAEVARRAGVSRMTVYRRYDDLGRLLSALLTDQLGAVVEQVEARVTRLPDARSRASAAVVETVAALMAYPLLRRVLDVDPETLLPLVVERLGSSQRLARDHLAALIRAGMTRYHGDGSVRTGDADRMALALVLAAQSYVFAGRVVERTDPTVVAELGTLTDRYLAP